MTRSGLLVESFHIWDRISHSLEHLRFTKLMAWMCPNLCGHFLCNKLSVDISEWLCHVVYTQTVCFWFISLQKSSCGAHLRAWCDLCSPSRPRISCFVGGSSQWAAERIWHWEPHSEVPQQKKRVGGSWLGCTGGGWATTAVSSHWCSETASKKAFNWAVSWVSSPGHIAASPLAAPWTYKSPYTQEKNSKMCILLFKMHINMLLMWIKTKVFLN